MLKAMATPGGGCRRVGSADHEAGALEAVLEIDLGAGQVLQAHRIDDDRRARGVDPGVVGDVRFLECKAVLEAGATAAGDVDAQLQRWIAFVGDEVGDF
jgi:hypothetical protein